MVDRGMKVMLAMSVLLSGIGGALLFRRSPDQSAPAPMTAPPLLLRERGAVDPPSDIGEETAYHLPDSRQPTFRRPEVNERPPSVLAPLDPGAPPPIMAKSFSRSPAINNSRWGTSMALSPPGSADPEATTITHKIVDGDTLEKLAERYLGRADRYMEIYEANRFLLPGPEVLPIGVELKIPQTAKPAAAPADNPPSQGPLVPITPRSPHTYGRP